MLECMKCGQSIDEEVERYGYCPNCDSYICSECMEEEITDSCPDCGDILEVINDDEDE